MKLSSARIFVHNAVYLWMFFLAVAISNLLLSDEVFAESRFVKEIPPLSIEVIEASDSIELSVKSLKPLSAEESFAENPLRFIVDLQVTKIQAGEVLELGGFQEAKKLRIGSHPEKTRLVLDLNGTIRPELSVTERTENKLSYRLSFSRVNQPKQEPQARQELQVQEPKKAPVSIVTPQIEGTTTPAVTLSAEPTETATIVATVAARIAERITATPEATIISPALLSPTSFSPSLSPSVTIPSAAATGTFTPTLTATPTVTRRPTITPIATWTEEYDTKDGDSRAEPRRNVATPTPISKASPVTNAEGDKKQAEAVSNVNPLSPETLSKDVEIPIDKLRELSKVNFSVDKVLLTFKGGERPIQNITVKNPGSKEIYVTAVAQRVSDPGSNTEKRIEVEDILVSPKRFSIPPQSERSVRVVMKDMPSEIERVYEIAFSVNKESFEAEFIDVQINGKPTRLRVVTDLTIIVLAEPPSPRVLIGAERQSDGLLVANRGSVSVRLSGGKVCQGERKEKCMAVAPRRLYPGNSWTMRIPPDWAAYFVKDSVLGYEQFFVPPAQ